MLSPAHQALLDGSAIRPETAAARGYWTATRAAELRRLGFGTGQSRVPALVIPVWGVAGEVVLYQCRPDAPRIVKGKALKYETPTGAHMALDVPPPIRGLLRDPAVPLFITEGVRKADSAASRGLCCIALLGVWNWRGSNAVGGRLALADWESIALNHRKVYIAFDSDVMTKPAVHAALERLKAFLEHRGADVLMVYLPPGSGGEKIGLDDYFAAGNSVPELLSHASPALRSIAHDDDTEAAGPYRIEHGRLCVEKLTRDGAITIPLCNFSCRIEQEVVIDNGVDETRAFVVQGRLEGKQPLPATRVAAAKFGSMNWIQECWGVRAIVAAGLSKRDQLREAIQLFSSEVSQRRVFAHTGWRRLDGRWVFLSSSGAIGAEEVEVDLGEGLSRYRLPLTSHEPVEAVRASLALLDLAPLTVTAPLWAAVYRSVLASIFPLDMSLWLEGVTGSLKSTIAALFLSHFGPFERTSLPGAWTSTANQLERRAFTLQDVLFVVDDYAPQALDHRELETKASRLLRAQGNLSGRGRLRADLTERPAMPPRGLILSTGEDRPAGRSILARTLLLELDRAQVDLDRLSAAQQLASRLPHALSGYITWLAPQVDDLRVSLEDAFRNARMQACQRAAHLRVPEILAHLAIGLDCGLLYAEEIKAIDGAQAAALRERCWEALLERADAQDRAVDEARPSQLFAELLAALILQQRVTLLPSHSGLHDVRPDKPLVGWYDDGFLYLVPEAAFQAVSRAARDAGGGFPLSEKRLRRDLVIEGVSHPDPDRLTASVRLGERTCRVLRLRRLALGDLLGGEFPVPSPVVTTVTGFGEER